MKKFKRIIALLLAVCMIASTPLSAMAAQPVSAQSEDTFSRVLHLDNGRKYFSKDWIIALVNEMEAAGYNQLQLAFGNDGMRFLLDDMSVTVNGTTYSDDAVTAGIKQGNKNYYNAGDANELTQAEMTEIVNYARSRGIDVVPHMNMPGHMDAILDAIEYVGISNAHFTGWNTSVRSLNLNNDTAVAFTHALLEKYVAYFDSLGCQYFHIGADEFGNDAYGDKMGFPNMGDALYAKFADFVKDTAGIVKDAGMTPRAWNDGISYQGYSESFDTDIQITYWSSGWNGYNVASAEGLSRNGHDMINTHGDYYYILGKTDKWDNNSYTAADGWSNTVFAGSTVSNPVGSMFCIWCDYPYAETETQIAANVRMVLRAMAAEMQGKDASAVSTEVVSGGFNADGSIAEGRAWNTVSSEDNTEIQVSGYEITRAEASEVAESALPSVEGAAKTKAWDITPYVGDEEYTGKGTVSLPVPAEWNTSLLKGFYVENGEVVLVEGTYADGKYTFNMPHFSVAGIYEATAVDDGDDSTDSDNRTINLILGESATDVIEGGNYAGTYTTDVATVAAEYEQVEGGTGPVQVDTVSAGSAYYLSDGNGNYLTSTAQWTKDINAAAQWTVTLEDVDYYLSAGTNHLYYYNNAWGVANYGDPFFFGNGVFSNAFSSNAKVIPVILGGTAAVNQTTVTFTGTTIGSATVEIGPIDYTVNVKYAEKTINVVKNGSRSEEQSVTVADYMDVTSLTNDYVTATWNGKTVNFAAKNQTGSVEMIIGNTKYTVNVIEEDLNNVDPLNIEYWQTNSRVHAPEKESNTALSVSATEAYSEEGLTLIGNIPATGYKDSTSVVYWRSRLLADDQRQVEGGGAADQTWSGTGFTKVRYWNGSWAVYTDESKWQEINPANYQLVAYYMNDMNLANEVKVGTSDWAKKGNVQPDWTNEGYVSIVYQVVYEDGTSFPSNATTSEVGNYSYLVNAWRNNASQVQRGVGTIALTQTGDYEIWKVTAETGEHTLTGNNTIQSVSWDNNERTLYEGETISQYTIHNPSQPESVIMDGDHENLYWDEYNESILIRVYVKAVETEDSLQVVYYDERFNDTLYSYNISVASGKTFSNGIKGIKDFAGNETPSRIDVSDAYIENALDKNQYFQTDLTQVPEAVGKYNSGLYEYTGSLISDDGKTLYLYYTINPSAVSPMFVADYGRPFTFNLSHVVKEGIETVDDVTVNGNTRYGTLSYNASSKEFTYTPTQILPNIDVLTINIKFDGDTTYTTTNAGVLPATTVDYEEGFATLTGFTGGSRGTAMQNTWVAGTNPDNDVYGYDGKVVTEDNTYATSTTKGDTAEFSFTGTGVDLYVNSDDASGNVAIQVRNADNRLVKVISVKTTSNSTITDAFSNTYQKELIAASVTGLAYGQYSVKITTTDPGTDGVYFDGFRVYGTMQDQANDYYKNDLEDNPVFAELRDNVLAGLEVKTGEITEENPSGSIYAEDIAESTIAQVYATANSTAGGIVLDNATLNVNAQDLLDNGPKNELFLLPGQSVVFKLTTNREVQVGMKAVNGTATVTGSYNGTITSERDMFYTIVDRADDGVAVDQTIIITNDDSSDSILSVTKVKICDDPVVAFQPLTEEDLIPALNDLGYASEEPEEEEVTLQAPTGVKATNIASTGKIKVTWKAVEGADKYKVYRATSKDGKYTCMKTTTGTSYTNTSAKPGKTYYYKVKALSDDKNVNDSEFSKVVKRTCDYARPVVTAKAGKKQVQLTWKKVEGAQKYQIYRATSPNGTYKKIYTTKNLKYTDKKLKAKKTYYYKVRAIGAAEAASAYSLVDKCKTKA